ncbi:hypothetical protein [Fervidibacillus albus]|uniref:Uncharacterized protein n=1 Tax=Fervidibacillus albus TaxID=2980026 RepID=A0A9E8RY67_9BACI|nr:hypothetical protein [Fervidibacillus albus]WAA10307.1 hypothetical protein OE104_02940 [Fervidibacillus albus]
MSKRLVAKHLSDREYEIFLKVHSKHSRIMGLEERKNYTLSHVVKVEWNLKERCLNVYYKNGEWFHYCPNGE